MHVNSTVAAVNENGVLTDLSYVWVMALHAKPELLALSFFPRRRTDLLQQRYKILKDSADPYEHQQKCGTP